MEYCPCLAAGVFISNEDVYSNSIKKSDICVALSMDSKWNQE